MKLALLAAPVSLLLLSGCDGSMVTVTPAPSATVTVTVTATVTETAAPDLWDRIDPGDLNVDPSATPKTSKPSKPPKLNLRVYRDGCGVIRSEAADDVDYQNLTWSVMDRGGFQVLGRNAEGETRYRYFVGGTYTVVLEAFVDGAYRAVSNQVTISC